MGVNVLFDLIEFINMTIVMYIDKETSAAE